MLILVQFEIQNEMVTITEPVRNSSRTRTLNAHVVFEETDSELSDQFLVNVVLSLFVSGRNPLFVRIREVETVGTHIDVSVFLGHVSLCRTD